MPMLLFVTLNKHLNKQSSFLWFQIPWCYKLWDRAPTYAVRSCFRWCRAGRGRTCIRWSCQCTGLRYCMGSRRTHSGLSQTENIMMTFYRRHLNITGHSVRRYRRSGQKANWIDQIQNSHKQWSHIPQCSIQNRNVHISVLNGALWDMNRCIVRLSYWLLDCCLIPDEAERKFRLIASSLPNTWLNHMNWTQSYIATLYLTYNSCRLNRIHSTWMVWLTVADAVRQVADQIVQVGERVHRHDVGTSWSGRYALKDEKEDRLNNKTENKVTLRDHQDHVSIQRLFSCMGISIIKIIRSWDRIIIILGIPLLVRRHLYSEMAADTQWMGFSHMFNTRSITIFCDLGGHFEWRHEVNKKYTKSLTARAFWEKTFLSYNSQYCVCCWPSTCG